MEEQFYQNPKSIVYLKLLHLSINGRTANIHPDYKNKFRSILEIQRKQWITPHKNTLSDIPNLPCLRKFREKRQYGIPFPQKNRRSQGKAKHKRTPLAVDFSSTTHVNVIYNTINQVTLQTKTARGRQRVNTFSKRQWLSRVSDLQHVKCTPDVVPYDQWVFLFQELNRTGRNPIVGGDSSHMGGRGPHRIRGFLLTIETF